MTYKIVDMDALARQYEKVIQEVGKLHSLISAGTELPLPKGPVKGFKMSNPPSRERAERTIAYLHAHPEAPISVVGTQVGLTDWAVRTIKDGTAWRNLPRPWLGNRTPNDVKRLGGQY